MDVFESSEKEKSENFRNQAITAAGTMVSHLENACTLRLFRLCCGLPKEFIV